MSFAGKVAVITGASSGIGAATAILFASEGCSLSITGRNLDNLQSIKAQCISEGLQENKIIALVGDVKDTGFLEELVKLTFETFSRIDILINNAGYVMFRSVVDTSLEQIDDIFATNFKAPIKLIQLCAPYLKEAKGNIVNVSSLCGRRPLTMVPVYSSTKVALDSITTCLAVEMAPDVRVNCINPGFTKTAIFGRHLNDQVSIDEHDDVIEKMAIDASPMGRMAESSEIANAILFLASDKAKYITGEKMVVDGGMMCGKKE